jgi:hypothetical protein
LKVAPSITAAGDNIPFPITWIEKSKAASVANSAETSAKGVMLL